ncbi:hypothetical protein JDV02_006981 [Purpureocillium takamizusanense]|uniref:Cytochrome b561 domain-containing protein n=1 Tax=Purpureocillium takamizusanense TaxID=2060973 RepID=A0A9Q8QJN9_9HYPO|nr:uncharacterized protein JDV02_006981 [Purpureocillium takamizusanense]UNI20935.1 hypothetical protein JDV02_006981 [Purpureocillium takamizusanense]
MPPHPLPLIRRGGGVCAYAILLASVASLALASLQYCNQRSHVQLHVCLAVDTYYNATSKAVDLLATFGYQVVSAGGWTAVGLGSSMYGALVIIGYVDHGEPTLDLRQATGHFEPKSLPALPVWTVPSPAVNTSGWFESSFQVYGYDSWLGLQGQSLGVQSFIWATSVSKTAQGERSGGGAFSLSMHDDKGHFSFDFGSRPVGASPSDTSRPPSIHFGKENDNAVEHAGGVSIVDGAPRAFVSYLHGFALVMGIMVLYPAGALALRFTELRPFRLHLYFQLGASLSCLVGFAAAGFIIGADPLRYLTEPHVLLGLVILLSIILQNAFGWLHHRSYKRGTRNTWVTSAHVIVGRCIIVLGSANALLGLTLARTRPTTLVFILTVFIADVLVVSCVWYAARERDGDERQKIGVPLLDDDPDGPDGDTH